jgi:hypothetical protein
LHQASDQSGPDESKWHEQEHGGRKKEKMRRSKPERESEERTCAVRSSTTSLEDGEVRECESEVFRLISKEGSSISESAEEEVVVGADEDKGGS